MHWFSTINTSYRDLILGFISVLCNTAHVNGQFFIPNPSTQLEQFQNPDPRFLDGSRSQGGSSNLADGFAQLPPPGADGFPGSHGHGHGQFSDATPTPLPKHLVPPPDFVCEETFGHYGDNQNCSRFFVCVFGLPVVQECSKGLHYNPQLGLCDWPKNTECPGKGAGFFAIPGTTTEPPARATIPWWLQGEDAPPASRPAPSLPSFEPVQHQQPLFERPRPNNNSDFLQQPQHNLASFPVGPSFPIGALPSTRRPWWNPWQPQNNDTWPSNVQPPTAAATSPRPTANQPDFQMPSAFQVQQDFAKFQAAQAQQQAALERDPRPSQSARPDFNMQLNPTLDFVSSRDGTGRPDQSRQELFASGMRPDLFGQSFARPDLSADAKPTRTPSTSGGRTKAPDFGSNPDLFPPRAPSRQDQIEQLLGFPMRPTQNQANDAPQPSAAPFSDSFGRQPFTGQLPTSFGQFPMHNQFGLTNDQTGFAGFPQIGADRFDGFSTTAAPRGRDQLGGSAGSGNGQGRPDLSGGNAPNRLLETGARPEMGGNRPDFASRFPVAGFADDQLQQPQRSPPENFPFPLGNRPERPGLASDFPTGFIPGMDQQLTQERLQQLAHERMQQMAGNRFGADQFGVLGFGTDRFSADQPSGQTAPQNAGIIRPSDRINGNQQARPEQSTTGFTGGRLNSAGGPFPGFADPQFGVRGIQNDGSAQFGGTTLMPFWQQQNRDGKTTTVPFWMQGSSNMNNNAPFPLNVFRTDIQRNVAAGMVPQPRILQNPNLARPAEMTTHPANSLDFETSAFVPQSLGESTESTWDSKATGPVMTTTAAKKVTSTTQSPFSNTTSKLPWWLQDSSSNPNQTHHASASSKVSSLGRNPSFFAKFAKQAESCDRQQCKLPECWCGGAEIPGGLPVGETPQVIMLTFDDAVTNQNYHLYTSIFSENRRNPNNCPIRGTFYVSHEWTEYFLVQNLYSDGHEIGSHSVSHTLPGKNFTKHDWADEIAGQREILSRFGNVKPEHVKGMRAPYLQTGGNNQFEMLWEKGFLYDSSMSVAENNPPLYPYTLDYALPHKCWIPPCPTKSYPGLWEVPLVHWEDLLGYRCAMADACHNPGDADEVYQLLMNNFKRHYETNRAPFGMYYHSAWFIHNYHMEGFKKFLDTVLNMPDVWIVTASQAIQWIQNPTPLSVINHFEPWNCANLQRPPHCNKPNVCPTFFRGGMRYIRTCEACPETYPWIKNTHGASRTQSNPTPASPNSVS